MMSVLRALAGKELQQHAVMLLWLTLFSLLCAWMLFALYSAGGGGLSYLSVTSTFANLVLVVVAFVVGQQLVAAEYYGRTQRFIETLPARHGSVHWVKYWFGYLYLFVMLLIVWYPFKVLAQASETVSALFAGIMLLRMAAFVFALWSIVFAISLLGRLRLPLIATAAFAIVMINNYTDFELNRFGPMALMDQDLFAFERASVPLRDLIETMAVGAAALVLGIWMARTRDGSLVETLAAPVTTRAKGFLIALGITALGVFTYFGPEPEAPPFEFTSPYVVADGNVEIAYLYSEFKPDAIRLMQYVVERSESLSEFLPPPGAESKLRISLDLGTEPTTYNTRMTDPIQGVVVDANFLASAGWDDPLFGAYVFHHDVASRKKGRLYLEPHHWILDGFTRWWSAYGEHFQEEIEFDVDVIMLEALYVTRGKNLGENTLLNWDISSEEFGESGSMTIAYTFFRVLQEQFGTAAALAFATEEFTRPTYGDVRDWWLDWRDPLPERFAKATEQDWDDFVALWLRRLEELRSSPLYRHALNEIAKSELTIEPGLSKLGIRSVLYTLDLDRPLPANSKCTVLHMRLAAFDFPVGRAMLREEELFWDDAHDVNDDTLLEYVLQGRYGQGSRVFAAVECSLPQFPAPVYLGSARLEIP